ncbi:MAG: zinc ribbon domain-containing protein [Chloroflexi bacterium]|nr:zinc ribbon domain-containing protein [Chloroflexota bacterium]
MCGGGRSHRERMIYREAPWQEPAPQAAQTTQTCPNCGGPVEEDFVLCPRCGTQLKRSCPSCHKAVDTDWVACPYCGATLEESA